MQNKKTGTNKKKAEEEQSRPGEVPLEPAGEGILDYKDTFATPSEKKSIHPRRPLPLVPEAPGKGTADSARESSDN
jgi:hypothetical protein